MRRVVASIGYNIAEGFGKRTGNDYISFLHIAFGSANEVEAQVEGVFRLGYLDEVRRDELVGELVEIKKMINGVIRFVRGKSVG